MVLLLSVRFKLTAISDAIIRLISFSWNDWIVTMDEQSGVVALLRTDPELSATIRDLISADALTRMLARVTGRNHPRVMKEMLGGGANSTVAADVLETLRRVGSFPLWAFQYPQELHAAFRQMGARFSRSPEPSRTLAGLIPTSPESSFGGVGATGVNPSTLSVPVGDQLRLWWENEEATRAYSNPIGDLNAYLTSVGPTNRRGQASLLNSRRISSVFPNSYRGQIPSRAVILRLAGRIHNLEPELIAGFILAEQRDQSRNEDAKDYVAATSAMQANTSIGLGQVVISTARREDLFSDLLTSATRSALSHDHIAMLLASDEFNIFAVAKYIRLTANRGARRVPASLPRTVAAYPGLNFGLYSQHSSRWPSANIAALGSEYTSSPWDDRVTGWGGFVLEAYRDVRASGSL
jgi:hypothetical protein